MSDSRVYAVASGKGGVGKTTTAAAFGACAAAAGRSAVVVDADLGMGNLGTLVGLDDATPTVHDVLAGAVPVADAVHEAPGGFDVVPGGAPLSAYADADPAALADVVETLREEYDVVVLDTGAGLSHDTVLPLGVADEVVLVTTPAAIAVSNTETTREVADRLGATVAGVLVTDAPGDVTEPSVDVDAPVLGTVPRDEAVQRAAAAGEPVPVHDPESPAARAYADAVAGLLEVAVTALDFPEDTSPSSAEEGVPAEAIPFRDADDGDADPEAGDDGAERSGVVGRLRGLFGG